jgi:predicted MPP superfamily phosphohydrolase
VKRPLSERIARALVQPPYNDTLGHKGWLEPFSRAQPHRVHRLALTIPLWPQNARPLRIAFLSDLHAGSHAGDLDRFRAVAEEAAAFKPDLVLHGGDFVNMQPLGAGRLSPDAIAEAIAPLHAPLGRYAVLGNHDYTYGATAVAAALESRGIRVLDNVLHTVSHDGHALNLIGLPDAHHISAQGRALLASLTPDRPAIVLAHDPEWFAHVAAGPHLTLSGHTHGGQVRLPFVGAVRNASRAPLRWTHGLIVEEGRHLYVTGGLGTSLIPLRIGVPPEYAVIDISG